MDSQAREIELIDFLLILWKRRWFIAIFVLTCAATTAILIFLLPRQWEVDAVIIPSKFLNQSEAGKLEEIVLFDPKQITAQINQGSYDAVIAAEQKLDPRLVPRLKAENLKDTNLVRIYARGRDTEKAKDILNSLLAKLKAEMDKKAIVEINNTDALIKVKEAEKAKLEEEIKTAKNKIANIQPRKKKVEDELLSTRKRTETLEIQQRAALKKEDPKETGGFGMLLYSNEIQQNLRYQEMLIDLLNNKKNEEENLGLVIRSNEQLIKQKENEITALVEKKGRIDFAQVSKAPTASLNPVSPQKKLIIGSAALFGLFASILLAFFLEYLEKSKIKT